MSASRVLSVNALRAVDARWAGRLRRTDLQDGKYVQVADVAGDEVFRAAQPFSAEVAPAYLVTGSHQH